MRPIDADNLELHKYNRYSEAIANAPTLDYKDLVPQGEWVKSEDDYCGLNIFRCSLCREEWCFEVDDDVKDLNYNFCPNCGARMSGARMKGAE